MSNVRTVSETKRAFYTLHTRPINSIYRRVVDELMVEMHLLSVNADFHYDSIYGLGVVTTFNRFMQGYRPEADQSSIFNAICTALTNDPQVYQQSAGELRATAEALSISDFLEKIKDLSQAEYTGLFGTLKAIADNPHFKYSRLFAIGLYTLLEIIDADLVSDSSRLNEALKILADALHLSQDKMEKDLELYRSNLEKMAQAQVVLNDILKADRKKKEERAKAKEVVSTESSSSTDEAS